MLNLGQTPSVFKIEKRSIIPAIEDGREIFLRIAETEVIAD
jgi:hypothetical protein